MDDAEVPTRQTGIRLRIDQLARLGQLAKRNGRKITAELRHAVDRHLAYPPLLTTPPLGHFPAENEGNDRKID